MTDFNNTNIETPENEVEKKVKASLMTELKEKTKSVFEKIKSSDKIGELAKAEKERMLRDLILIGLAACELVPVLELADEATVGAMVIKKIQENAATIKKKGKELGSSVAELYPDIPEWLVLAITGLDEVGVPYIGAAPEVVQFLIDFKPTIENQTGIVKETATIVNDVFFNKSEYTQGQIKEAQLVFASEETK